MCKGSRRSGLDVRGTCPSAQAAAAARLVVCCPRGARDHVCTYPAALLGLDSHSGHHSQFTPTRRRRECAVPKSSVQQAPSKPASGSTAGALHTAGAYALGGAPGSWRPPPAMPIRAQLTEGPCCMHGAHGPRSYLSRDNGVQGHAEVSAGAWSADTRGQLAPLLLPFGPVGTGLPGLLLEFWGASCPRAAGAGSWG